MDQHQQTTAAACLRAAEDDSLAFPQIVGRLVEAGFESYAVDLRRGTAIYHLPDGDSLALATRRCEVPIAAAFDLPAIQAAIREAQQRVPGYHYAGFCRKIAAAGCAGYVVSFSGRRAVYLGRTAELHVEHFPPG